VNNPCWSPHWQLLNAIDPAVAERYAQASRKAANDVKATPNGGFREDPVDARLRGSAGYTSSPNPGPDQAAALR
jgi:hypothetical protein